MTTFVRLGLYFLAFLGATDTFGQCSLITTRGSRQNPSSVCSPVNFSMDVGYKFLLPVNPSLVEVMFVWNDGFGSRTIVPAMSGSADSVFASASHFYLPTTECARTAQAFLIYDGDTCTSQGYQEQTFSTWGTDEQNGAVIETNPVVYYVCEGDPVVDVRFDDASTFNCNIAIEPDLPNRYYRWVQFEYNTYGQGGDRIPSVVVTDNGGLTYPMTDGAGNFITDLEGPIIRIPIPADGPNQTSYRIDAPAGGVAGDIFELTLRNWNVCNRYDNNPEDGVPPADAINGDNPPIFTRARIEIISTPPVLPANYYEYCAGDPIMLHAGPATATIRWYTDAALSNLVFVGYDFNPTLPPLSLNNNVAGTHTFYVTATRGACESAPYRIDLQIFSSPNNPNAGPNQQVCADTATLQGNIPAVGVGYWTTSSLATIADSTSRITIARNLQPGPNVFYWHFVNGPCHRTDNVIIYRDIPPGVAQAGPNQSVCNSLLVALAGNNPVSGQGTWSVVSGSGVFSDSYSPSATVTNPASGINLYEWSLRSIYGVCPTSRDTMQLLYDRPAGVANAGPDIVVCDTDRVNLNANPPANGGMGSWGLVSGSAGIANPADPATSLNAIAFGSHVLAWQLTSAYGICPATTDTLLVSRYPQPDDAVAGANQLFCTGYSAALSANIPVVGTGQWRVVQTPTSIAPAFVPGTGAAAATVSITAGNEGLYRLVWEITNGTCIKTDTISIDFGTLLTADAGADDTVCGGQYRLNGNNPAPGLAKWSVLSGPSGVLFLPSANRPDAVMVVGPGTQGTYLLKYSIVSGSCPEVSDTVAITFYPEPGLPIASGDSACGASAFNVTATPGVYGDMVRWYADAGASTLLHTGNSFSTPLLTSTTTYYISTLNTISGCEGSLRPVTIRINPIPATPVPVDAQRCGTGAAILISSIGNMGNTNRWYDAPVGGTMVAQSQHFISFTSTDLHLFVATADSVSGCESARVPVDFTVHPVPASPVAQGAIFCGQGSAVLFSGIGSGGHANRWYDANSGGTLVGIDTAYSTTLLDTTTSFWVSTIDTSTGCESVRTEAEVVINPVPGIPLLTDAARCGAGSVTIYGAPGTNGNAVRWYELASSGAPLAQQDSFVTPYLTTSRLYFASTFNTLTGCESSREEVVVSVNPVPPPLTITGLTDVELGSSGIYIVNYAAGSLYAWSVDAGITLEEDNGYFVRLSFPVVGSFTLSVHETTFSGCPGVPANKFINVRERTLDARIVLSSPNGCTGTQLQVLADVNGGTPPYNYSWSGDVAHLSVLSVANPIFDADIAGNFTLQLQVQDVNGNIFADTVSFEVFPSPQASIRTPDTLVCAGSELTLDVDVAGSTAAMHRWWGGVDYLSSLTVQEPVFRPLAGGVFNLHYELTDVHGCISTDSVQLTAEKPYVRICTDAIPGCSPLVVAFDNETISVNSFHWDFGDGQQTSLPAPEHLFSNTTPAVKYYNVVLTGTSILGCQAKDETYITVWPNPDNAITLTPDSSCSPAVVMVTAVPGSSVYRWDMGDGSQFDGGYNLFHTFVNTSGVTQQYTVSLSAVNTFGCASAAISRLTVFPSPAADFEVTPADQMFPDAAVTVDNRTAGSWNYRWYFGDGSTSSLTEPGAHTYEFPNNFVISLVAYDSHCSDSALRSVRIRPHPPVAKFAPIDPGCMPLSVTFVNGSEFADDYLWEFGDGTISTIRNPSYTYYQPGKYKIKLTVTGKGGSDSVTDSTEVWVLPNSFFDLAPRYVYVNDEPIHYFNQAENADFVEWDFGDGTSSTEVHPVHTYTTAGTYDVTLKVWTSNGCFDLYIMENAVFVKPPGEIAFPNAFRPDSPVEENRIFLPGVVDNVTNYHLRIYNRWGQLLFESFDQNIGWDGYYDGSIAKQDVYIFKVEGVYSDGVPFVKVGDVTLLR